jgi:hypothetical protein
MSVQHGALSPCARTPLLSVRLTPLPASSTVADLSVAAVPEEAAVVIVAPALGVGAGDAVDRASAEAGACSGTDCDGSGGAARLAPLAAVESAAAAAAARLRAPSDSALTRNAGRGGGSSCTSSFSTQPSCSSRRIAVGSTSAPVTSVRRHESTNGGVRHVQRPARSRLAPRGAPPPLLALRSPGLATVEAWRSWSGLVSGRRAPGAACGYLALGHVPLLDRLIRAPREQEAAVGRDNERVHAGRVTLQPTQRLSDGCQAAGSVSAAVAAYQTALRVPLPDALVAAGGIKQAAVVADSHSLHALRVPAECVGQLKVVRSVRGDARTHAGRRAPLHWPQPIV